WRGTTAPAPPEEAEALSEVAEEAGVLFLNAGATADRLRQDCREMTFHVEPSAAMYLDALLGWFVRAGFRRWHFVHDDSPESVARHDRARAARGGRGALRGRRGSRRALSQRRRH
ncbi:hypothetical protein CNY89_25730, partial [Amaricoccus sp. HAR-UPW-R2A-40]